MLRVEQAEPWLYPYVPAAGDLALDVGASYGAWSEMLMLRFGEVWAIEPHPEAAKELRRLDGLRVIECAASRREGPLTLNLYAHSWHASLAEHDRDALPARGAPVGECAVRGMPIDDLVRDRQVDFVKIDVEGWEAAALEGADKTLRQSRPTLIIEVHWADRSAITKHLVSLGYLVEHVELAEIDYVCWLVARAS